jgi:hypothetical protein
MKRQQGIGRTEPFSSDIEPVRRQLEAWRKTRQHRARIPEPLWAAMAKLGKTYGISPVSGALGIDYYALKDRVTASPRSASAISPAQATFIEVKPLPVSQTAGCRVELKDRSGTKMTLHLDGSHMDALSLAQAFWRRRP